MKQNIIIAMLCLLLIMHFDFASYFKEVKDGEYIEGYDVTQPYPVFDRVATCKHKGSSINILFSDITTELDVSDMKYFTVLTTPKTTVRTKQLCGYTTLENFCRFSESESFCKKVTYGD